MKTYYHYKKLLGVGLIEVLVATVVISTGLLSVASMQGEFLGTSAENKIKEEAKNLCQTKIEQLRDSVANTSTTYQAIASSTANETITGVNETYTRSWVVADKTDPSRKEITATCSWQDNSYRVIAQGIISFQDIAIQLAVASGSGIGDSSDSGDGDAGLPVNAPSTNAESSDEFNDPVDVLKTSINLDEYGDGAKIIDTSDGKGSVVYACSDLSAFDSTNSDHIYTRRVYYKGSDTSFKDAIELFEGDSTNTNCTRKIRFNGGVVIPLRGIVYSRADDGNGGNPPTMTVNKFSFNSSESGIFCAFSPSDTAVHADYSCYIGGNCINGSTDDTYSTTDMMQCPPYPDSGSSYPDDTYTYIGEGGWRGKIGLQGIIAEDKAVCFAEEIADDGGNLTKDSARNYYTRRNTGTDAINEGINKAYTCHNFLISEQKATLIQHAGECLTRAEDTTADDGAGSLVGFIASKNIENPIATDVLNKFNPTIDDSACTVYFNITVTTGTATCNSNSCSNIEAGTYAVEVNTNDGFTCSGNFTISSNTEITVDPIRDRGTTTGCELTL